MAIKSHNYVHTSFKLYQIRFYQSTVAETNSLNWLLEGEEELDEDDEVDAVHDHHHEQDVLGQERGQHDPNLFVFFI
jgi:hypothetical protein